MEGAHLPAIAEVSIIVQVKKFLQHFCTAVASFALKLTVHPICQVTKTSVLLFSDMMLLSIYFLLI